MPSRSRPPDCRFVGAEAAEGETSQANAKRRARWRWRVNMKFLRRTRGGSQANMKFFFWQNHDRNWLEKFPLVCGLKLWQRLGPAHHEPNPACIRSDPWLTMTPTAPPSLPLLLPLSHAHLTSAAAGHPTSAGVGRTPRHPDSSAAAASPCPPASALPRAPSLSTSPAASPSAASPALPRPPPHPALLLPAVAWRWFFFLISPSWLRCCDILVCAWTIVSLPVTWELKLWNAAVVSVFVCIWIMHGCNYYVELNV